ncbi:hypothetical protein EE612_028692 [Oryza sativa]|nr:hypothetical protein EE612_028692 [Oryza sativa]
MVARLRSRRSGGEEEEGPCRSFEERLMEMLLEEGRSGTCRTWRSSSGAGSGSSRRCSSSSSAGSTASCARISSLPAKKTAATRAPRPQPKITPAGDSS